MLSIIQISKVLPFIDDWKNFWITTLQHEDEVVLEYIKQHSHTNPLLVREKQYPKQFKERNEMYVYEYSSNHGENFFFHFEIEKVNK